MVRPDRTLDATAAEHGVELAQSAMADLNRLGREIAEGMNGVTSVSVSTP